MGRTSRSTAAAWDSPTKPLIAAVEGFALADGALALAKRITVNGPLAVAATKQVITQARGWTSDEMFREQWKILGAVFVSNDAKEGAVAFAEKRPPRWTGT